MGRSWVRVMPTNLKTKILGWGLFSKKSKSYNPTKRALNLHLICIKKKYQYGIKYCAFLMLWCLYWSNSTIIRCSYGILFWIMMLNWHQIYFKVVPNSSKKNCIICTTTKKLLQIRYHKTAGTKLHKNLVGNKAECWWETNIDIYEI